MDKTQISEVFIGGKAYKLTRPLVVEITKHDSTWSAKCEELDISTHGWHARYNAAGCITDLILGDIKALCMSGDQSFVDSMSKEELRRRTIYRQIVIGLPDTTPAVPAVPAATAEPAKMTLRDRLAEMRHEVDGILKRGGSSHITEIINAIHAVALVVDGVANSHKAEE